MKKYVKLLRNEKGFTLVELMIVISIIAVLAVVLVPKIGSMRDSVKNQGVVSNVNNVRAYLELRVNSREATAALEAPELQIDMTAEFQGSDVIKNPFTNGETIFEGWTTADNYDTDNSVIIRNLGGNAATYNIDGEAWYVNTYVNTYGKVFVYVCNDGYILFGKDVDGNSYDYIVIR